MTNAEIRQFIIDKIPYEIETSGITNKYYVISVNQKLSLELGIIDDGRIYKFRILKHLNDHHINDVPTRVKSIDFIDLNTKVHSVKKEDRRKIVDLLKALPLYIEDLMGYDRSVVSDGGADVASVDSSTPLTSDGIS